MVWDPGGACALGVLGAAGFAVVEWSVVPVGEGTDPEVPVVVVDPAGGVGLGRTAVPMLPIPAGVRMPPESPSGGIGVLRAGGTVTAELTTGEDVAAEEGVARGCPETTPAAVVGLAVPTFDTFAGVPATAEAAVESIAGFGATTPGLTGNLLTGAASPPATT